MLLSLLVLFVAGASVSAVFAWRIVSAIVEAEKVAVVPLPTRSIDFAGSQDSQTPTPTSEPEPTDLPNVRAATPASGSPEAASPVISPDEDAVEPVGTPSPSDEVAQDQGRAELPTSGDPSRLDVLQQIVGVSIGDGDPGRSEVWGGRESLNILVLGVDRRPEGGDQNADVIILARVDLVQKKVAAVSIPRDLLVDIPGVGPDKINGAFNYGVQNDPDNPAAGVAMVRDTVEYNFGVPIDGYVLIDFEGFEQVIDAVGGVTVDVPAEIVDEEFPTTDFGTEVVIFEPGEQTMDGESALKYVRTRHGDNDDQRRQRQLQVLMALFDKAKGVGSISRGDEIILALSDNVQTSFGLEQQLTLARVGYEMTEADITLTTIEAPLIWEGYTEDGRWVYLSDLTAVAAFINESLELE